MKYWVYLEGRQQGPFDLEQMRELPLTADTKVWCAGMERWERLASVPVLAQMLSVPPQFRTSPPPEPNTAVHVVVDSECVEVDAQAPEQPRIKVASPPPAPRRPEKLPESYLPLSIALGIFCCSPISIAAIISSVITLSYNRKIYPWAKKASEVTECIIRVCIALRALPMLYFALLF